MKISLERLNDAIVPFRFTGWLRIMPAKHRATPASAGYGSSRFSSPDMTYKVLYVACDFKTSFAEAVIRDLYQEKSKRYIGYKRLDELAITEIETIKHLDLLDLRRGKAYDIGIDTDAKGARDHKQGQALSKMLHDNTTADGIVFNSRFTAEDCIVVFERAFPKIVAKPAIDLFQHSELKPEIQRKNIIVRRRIAPLK